MDYIGIFQGGGMKGIAYAGAYFALEEKGFKCKKASGTSIGAIFAGLISAGYNAKDITYLIETLNFSALIPKKQKNIKNIIGEKGLYSTNYIEEELRYLLSLKGIRTFSDLWYKNEYKLKVIGTDFKKHKQIIFPNNLIDYQINPNFFPVAKAITMSATYPGFFKPQKLKNTYVLDGGIVNNFPCRVFNYQEEELVIGFKIQNKDHKNNPKQMYQIIIDTSGYKILDFTMDKEKQWELFKKGYLEGIKIADQIIKDKDHNA